jgi:gliding motility-associated-like protein
LGANNGFPNNTAAWSPGTSPLTMQFTTPGSYQMKLYIGNSCGIDDTTFNFCVVAQPQPQFSVNPSTSCYPPALNVAATNSTVVPSNACIATTYAYNWSVSPATGWAFSSPGTATSTNTNFTFSAVGNYAVTLQASVNNLAGCSATTTQPVTINQAPTVNAGNDISVCASGATVQLVGSPTGGTWSGTGVNSTGLYTPAASAGSATLTYTIPAAGSCPSLSDQLVVTINPKPTITVAPLAPAICNGNAVSLTASSSIASSTFSWSPATGLSSTSGATVSASPTATTTYTVTGTAPTTGCSNTANIPVTVNPNPTVSVPTPSAICAGSSTTLTATGAGGLGPYSYSWSPATGLSSTTIASVSANPSITTTYTVTVTDSRGCTGTNTVTVTVNAIPPVNAGNDVSICNGSGANPLTGFSPSGGSWSGAGVTSAGVFTPTALGNVTLTYSVTQNGCTATDQIIVSVIAPSTANAGADQGVCLNAAAINLTGTPATGSWTGSSFVTTGGVFTPSSVGVYTLTYSIGSGSCLSTDQKVITVYTLPTVSVNDPTICAGAQATLTATGASGQTPYTYSWSPAAGLSATSGASVTTSPATSTSYTVTVSDAHSCTATDVSAITVNPIPTANAGSDVSICNGSSNNSLTGFSPAGGTWSGPGVTSTGEFTPSALGNVTLTYSVTLLGCTGTDQIIVTVINPTNANAGADQGICLNAPAITLTGTPSGGSWSGDPLVTGGGVFTPSASGTHTLTYSYGSGSCATSDTKIVTVYSLPTVGVNDLTICAGDQATLTAVGASGQTPFSYLWTPATGLSSTSGASVTTSPTVTTSYTVTVSDANTCSASDISTITVNPIPSVNAGLDVGVCNTPTTYTLAGGTPSGGTWTGIGVTPTGVFTPNGVASVTLTYSYTQNGCTGTDDVILNVTNPTPANAGLDQHICLNAPVISLTGSPAGGTWSGQGVDASGSFTPSIQGVTTLTYSYGNGNCAVSDQVDIDVLQLPSVSVSPISFCAGLSGTLQATGSGGAGSYSYNWSPASGLSATTGASVTADSTLSGVYSVSITDANTCSSTSQVAVTVNQLPIVNAGADLSVCNTPTTTQLIPITPLTGTWSGLGVSSTGAFIPTTTGSFVLTYTFTDGNSCINSDSLIISVTDPGTVNAGLNDSICLNASPLQLSGTPVGGGWTGSTYVNLTGEFTPSQVGIFPLYYTVGQGTCAITDTLVITTLELPEIAGQGATICAFDTIALTVSGTHGTGSYSFSWSPSDSLSSATGSTVNAFPVLNQDYTVTLTDIAGCSDQQVLSVIVNQLPIVDAGADLTVCFTSIPTVLSGESPSGGLWFGPGVLNGAFVPPAAGIQTIYYTYTEASTGCVNLDSILVTANNPDIVNAGNDTSVCVTYDPFLLTGQSHIGGQWTGDAQVDVQGVFTATQVGAVTLTYTTGTGTCAVSDDRIITVLALPVVEAGTDTSVCVNSPPFNFSGESPTGLGTWAWTGTGISDTQLGEFDPLSVPSGNYVSVYTYTETATGCVNKDSLTITVNALTPVQVSADPIQVCLTPFNTILTATPVGGIWTGSDINFLYNTDAVQDTAGFIPTVNGTFLAFYTFSDANQCINADTSTITVVSPIDADAGPDVSYCYSLNDTVHLVGLPANGTWTDSQNPTWLLTDGSVLLNQADTSDVIFTVGSGSCQTWDTASVVIFPLPFVEAGVDTFRCLDDPCFQLLPPIPTGGLWSGNGITNSNGLFCSQIAGEGSQLINYAIDTIYSYQNLQSTCHNEDSLSILVVPMPIPGLTIDPVLCINVNYTLGNQSSGPASNFEWIITEQTQNDTVFYSTSATPTINITSAGNYQLILNSISPYGCSVSTSSSFIVVEPPVPQFAISADLACAPYQGSILNTSVGYNLTYDWNFGPLFPSSSLASPQLPVFPSPVIGDSLFYVELSLTNLCGTRTYKDSIIIRPLPVAVITTDYSIGCSPMTLVFQNISYGSPETFLWDFDNGTTSTDSLPTPLVFQAINFPHAYNVTVTVTNSCGVDTDTASVIIYPNSFSIGSVLPQTACAPFEFSFQSPSTGQTFYLWDFGDGEGAIGETVSHLYPTAGNYTVQLTVSNFCFSDTVYSTLQLLEGPSLDFNLSASSICEDTEVTLNNTSTIGGNYSWLIDSTPTPTYSSPVTQLFNQGGNFAIGLSGTHPTTGCIDTVYKPLSVWARPTINISADPDTGCVPLLAHFTNATQNATAYEWNFSNGTGSSQAEPSLLVSGLGLFSAELIAHNYQSSLVDCPDTATVQVWVNPTPTSLFSLSEDAGCGPPSSVQVINQSANNLTFQWEWLGGTSSLSAPQITFADTGLHAVSLSVTNQFQCSDTSSKSYRVFGQPDIAFNLIPIEGCAPLKVDFLNLTEYGDSVTWGFGDGNFSTLPVTQHMYEEPGMYAVELFVSSGNGLCYDDTLASQAVWVHPVANAAFSIDPPTISQDEPLIALYNHSNGYNSLEFYIDSVLYSDELPATYMFQDPDSGLVQLTLIVNNEFGCPDTSTQDVMIKSAPSFYFPNSFSPNNDGKNDEYRIYFDRAPTYYHVEIYDRWGHRVFQSNDYNEAWNGTYLNRGGEPIKCDVYVLKFSAIFEGTIKIKDLYKNVNVIH